MGEGLPLRPSLTVLADPFCGSARNTPRVRGLRLRRDGLRGRGRVPLLVRRGDFTMTEQRADVYTRITTQIVAAIEAGTGDWRMPWHHDGAATTRPQNVTSRKRYRGVNVLALWIAAEASGYSSGLWGTYRQWASLGAQVCKGEHGTTIVFWKQVASRAEDDRDDGEAGPGRMFARRETAPGWFRRAKPLIVAHHRLRKLFNGLYRQNPLDESPVPLPWWKSDRTWAAVLVACTLGLCWYFA